MINYTENINKDLNKYIKNKNYSKTLVLVDENTENYCLGLLDLKFKYQIIKITSGENNKNINTVSHIWEKLLNNNADRASLLINLGGGVISDMGGFAASTYKRGIEFINIPTTLLAMVDATIGGKTGFNFQNKKNMIGLFSTPKAIFIDVNFIKTLTKREYLNGIAEVLKHGLLFDMEYFNEVITFGTLPTPSKQSILLTHPSIFASQGGELLNIIKKSISMKKKIVEEDFEENGLRKILNLGHTIGHAFESHFINDKNIDLKHGEAVIIGLIAMLKLSVKKLGFDISLQKSITNDLKKIYSLDIYSNYKKSDIIKYLIDDKKNKNGDILMVLLEDINKPVYDVTVSIEEIEGVLTQPGGLTQQGVATPCVY